MAYFYYNVLSHFIVKKEYNNNIIYYIVCIINYVLQYLFSANINIECNINGGKLNSSC